jgi:hypothetical protein
LYVFVLQELKGARAHTPFSFLSRLDDCMAHSIPLNGGRLEVVQLVHFKFVHVISVVELVEVKDVKKIVLFVKK